VARAAAAGKSAARAHFVGIERLSLATPQSARQQSAIGLGFQARNAAKNINAAT
jgi:hypothetical protein